MSARKLVKRIKRYHREISDSRGCPPVVMAAVPLAEEFKDETPMPNRLLSGDESFDEVLDRVTDMHVELPFSNMRGKKPPFIIVRGMPSSYPRRPSYPPYAVCACPPSGDDARHPWRAEEEASVVARSAPMLERSGSTSG